MAYIFYMDGLALPVTPSKLTMKIKNQNKTANTINDGEINFLKSPGLTDISFEFLIPHAKYPFSRTPEDMDYYLSKLEELKEKKKPFQFIVSRTSPGGDLLFDTNLKVSLEDYDITEDAKNGLDLTVSVSLKQYKDYGAKIVAVSETSATKVTTTRAVSKASPTSYTVVAGDTLWTIAKMQLGEGSKYSEIASRNGIVNPNIIYAGQVLKLA